MDKKDFLDDFKVDLPFAISDKVKAPSKTPKKFEAPKVNYLERLNLALLRKILTYMNVVGTKHNHDPPSGRLMPILPSVQAMAEHDREGPANL
jgi:hypothetical protein